MDLGSRFMVPEEGEEEAKEEEEEAKEEEEEEREEKEEGEEEWEGARAMAPVRV